MAVNPAIFPLINASLNGANSRFDCLGVVMGGYTDENVYFANIDQLANKIVGEYALVCHGRGRMIPNQIRRSLNQ